MMKLYTTEELASFYGVCEETVRRWARSKKIKGVRPGQRWFFYVPEEGDIPEKIPFIKH